MIDLHEVDDLLEEADQFTYLAQTARYCLGFTILETFSPH